MIEIITPCSRPENLEQIRATIPAGVNWIVCYDTSKVNYYPNIGRDTIGAYRGEWGNTQRNAAMINANENSFVYCLDDDNLLHPNFYNGISKWDLSQYDIITFDQLLEDGSIRNGNNPTRTNIDQAQFLIRRSIHEPYEQEHDADGILIEKLVKKYPHRWLYIPKVLSYYNRLKWKQ